MKILITGICGFVGSSIAESLREAGHEVFGFDSHFEMMGFILQPK